MTEEELSFAEDGLRTILRTYVPAWVLREVDQTIAEGVAEARYLQRRAASRYDSYSYLYEAIAPTEGGYQATRKSSSTLVISTRPMLAVERVRQLIDATRSMLVELPAAEDEVLTQVIELSGASPEEVSVAFLGSDDDLVQLSSFSLQSDRIAAEERIRISGLLDQLERGLEQ